MCEAIYIMSYVVKYKSFEELALIVLGARCQLIILLGKKSTSPPNLWRVEHITLDL
jgi:hypothetical protein